MFGGTNNKIKGTLLGPHGQDLLPLTPSQFDTFMSNLCGTDGVALAVGQIKDAVAAGRMMQYQNTLPTTNPKCYSVPHITVDRHCNVNIDWTAGSDDEIDCTELGLR
jgi:hypothetical protein